jgi:uncharacterized membrane protein YecN with MAPEG domain
MTLFEIVALYAAINLILAPILMYRVGQIRLGEKISLGDGGNDLLQSRIRAHGNFTENAPLLLIGLFALASLSAAPLLLHIFGAAFTLGRIIHAIGMAGKISNGRLIGTLTTILSYLGMAITLIYLIAAS